MGRKCCDLTSRRSSNASTLLELRVAVTLRGSFDEVDKFSRAQPNEEIAFCFHRCGAT